MKTVQDYFSIEVKSKSEKDDKGNAKVIHSNKIVKDKDSGDRVSGGEVFEYTVCENLLDAIEAYGGKLDDNQKQFLTEAIAAEETQKGVDKILAEINSSRRDKAKGNAYQNTVIKFTPAEDPAEAEAKAVRVLISLGIPEEIAKATVAKTLADNLAAKSQPASA